MRTTLVCSLIAILATAGAGRVHAAPILAIDMDLAVAGIQSLRTVAPGASLDVAVLAWDDGSGGPVSVDSVLLDVTTESLGVAVLGAVTTAGLFADALSAVDGFVLTPVVSGTALFPFGVPGGASLGGPLGYFDCPLGFPLCLTPPPTGAPLPGEIASATTLIAFSVTAGAVGSEILSISEFPIGFGGFAVDDTVRFSATLTVEADATDVPEPAPTVLLAAGLLALVAGSRRRRF